MKRFFLTSFLIALMAFSFAGSGFARHEGGSCPLKGKSGCGSGDCCQGKSHGKSECPIVSKLMKKAHFFLENQKAIGLKEDQVNAIKAIKMDAEKTEIRNAAEMQVFHIDLTTKLSEPQVDVEGLNKMIDGMASGMTSGAKATIASYVKLKAVLTAEQQAKAKEIWLQNESSGHAH